jgi:hypothetical protein
MILLSVLLFLFYFRLPLVVLEKKKVNSTYVHMLHVLAVRQQKQEAEPDVTKQRNITRSVFSGTTIPAARSFMYHTVCGMLAYHHTIP